MFAQILQDLLSSPGGKRVNALKRHETFKETASGKVGKTFPITKSARIGSST